MHIDCPSLTLGTAQLGMRYGIGAAASGFDAHEAERLLDTAWELGIRSFDTARAYGEAETRLGTWVKRRNPSPRPIITSKFPALDTENPTESLHQALDGSRTALSLARIDNYLAHNHEDLLRPGVAEALRRLAAEGKIGAFGASIYTPKDGDAVLGVPGLAVLQLPFNLVNPAMRDSGLIDRARDAGIAIFVRSIFLQGLLLVPPAGLPARFVRAAPVLHRLCTLAAGARVSVPALALGAVTRTPGITSIVIGADSTEQIAENVRLSARLIAPSVVEEAFAIAGELPEELRDPRRWPG